jgi:hypothetical protein
MTKQEAEWSNKLSIFWLKKHGYLDGGQQSGVIKWTYGISGNESRIEFTIMIDKQNNWSENNYIQLRYTHTSQITNKKEDMNYKIEITTTPCNYGGKRYWFICPLTKNGKYCGRRIGVLYSIDKWFGCRHCGRIAYASQMRGGRFRGSSISLPDVEQAEKEIKRYYYNGEPTKKYKRLIRMRAKLHQGFMLIGSRLDE